MYPPNWDDRCGVEHGAAANDPETAEEVREALAIARAQAAALREELRRLRNEYARQRAELAAARRWRCRGAALAEELVSELESPEPDSNGADPATGLAGPGRLTSEGAAARLRLLHNALIEWRAADSN